MKKPVLLIGFSFFWAGITMALFPFFMLSAVSLIADPAAAKIDFNAVMAFIGLPSYFTVTPIISVIGGGLISLGWWSGEEAK